MLRAIIKFKNGKCFVQRIEEVDTFLLISQGEECITISEEEYRQCHGKIWFTELYRGFDYGPYSMFDRRYYGTGYHSMTALKKIRMVNGNSTSKRQKRNLLIQCMLTIQE